MAQISRLYPLTFDERVVEPFVRAVVG